LLNKLTVSQLAELSKLSKPYVSQVKNGKRPPSKILIKALLEYAKDIFSASAITALKWGLQENNTNFSFFLFFFDNIKPKI